MGRFSPWITKARQYQERLEKRPWVAFPLESFRRFNKIEGKHLAIVIALNLFVAVIPLIIIATRSSRHSTRIATSATCWHRTCI
jgi:uncharacterized BrkB/YihY/UPF0761 family membrane protein